jgi:hypothetical protein
VPLLKKICEKPERPGDRDDTSPDPEEHDSAGVGIGRGVKVAVA